VTFWLSFTDGKSPGRIVLLDGEDEVVVRVKAHAMGFYRKGDQILVLPLPEQFKEELALPRNRWLTEEEIQSVGAEKLGDVDPALS
jgi:hypothetical protein